MVAEGIPSPLMYEVVEVGEERLIGEIIRISGDKSYIQVYETTSGVRPGELVYATGAPLSAELGPGLIGQIFDGIQRPLSKILETSKSIFVRRGVKLPSIPRDVKYHFTPLQGLKPGVELNPGDVLGYVDETPLIKHPIIVPPNIRGRLIELSPEGDYTVEEPIAFIERDGDKIGIKMLSKWPVRVPRPYKMKLDPVLPLITGMRIIDTFFPMAKGGTGAIPGAFGTGKCLLPGTPVMLANGNLVPIEKIFKRIKGGEPSLELDEEVYEVGSKTIYVYSFNGREFIKMPISHVYRGKTDKIIRVRTKRGRVIEVTPIHRLIIFDPEKGFVEIPAASLRKGDLLVVPRKIDMNTKARINLYKYIPEAVSKDPVIQKKFIKVVRKLAEKYEGGLKGLSQKLGIEDRRLYNMVHRIAYPPLWLIEKVFKMAGLKPPHPRVVSYRWSPRCVKIPEEIDGAFAYILGMLVGNGRLYSSEYIRIYVPRDDINQELLEDVIRGVFGDCDIEKIIYWTHHKDPLGRSSVVIQLKSKILRDILFRTGFATEYFTKKKIPSIMLRASESAIKYFLAGYFRVMGLYRDGMLYILSYTKDVRDKLTYLLNRIGIGNFIVTEGSYRNDKGYEQKIYAIIIYDNYDIVKFYDEVLTKELFDVGYLLGPHTLYREVLNEIKTKRDEILKKIPSEYLVIPSEILDNYLGISPQTVASIEGTQTIILQRTALRKKQELLKKYAEIFKKVTVDPVEEIELLYGEWVVYDVTVPSTHNFVGGYIPSIFHNTVTLHSLAMWSDAKVVIYIGCGERGNEMTEVLERFPETKDPWSGRPLMERTILIANTSNMPVSAREASIYVGITLGEYYRDLGYDVLLVADSTSRWAEALREIAGRLEEMPAEEGYPSYLQSRLAEFYERAGRVIALGSPERTGSVTVIGAVSPPGGDFTEPVTTHTRRFIRVFWALDASLAYSRHYPAINWITSYSAYTDLVGEWWSKEVDPSWRALRDEALNILLRENELREVVRLIGVENLPEPDKLIMDIARMIKDGFLRQNAYDPIDAFSSPQKQFKLLRLLLKYYKHAKELVDSGIPVATIREKTQKLVTSIVKARFSVRNDELDKLDELEKEIDKYFEELKRGST